MRKFILAIDPSLSSTGWAIIDKDSRDVVDLGKICTKNKIPEDDRGLIIINVLLKIKNKYMIEEAAMEDGFMHQNMKTGMQLAKLRGGIIFTLRRHGVSVVYKQPSEIKLVFVGNGNAKKEAVAKAIMKMFPDNIYVQSLGPFSDKNNKKKNSDMYDAISIGIAYLIEQQNNTSVQTA